MKDKEKTQAQLIKELETLRQRSAQLAAAEFERKRVEEELRQSEEYSRSLIENALDMIVILEANGTLRYQSPSA